MSVCDALCCSYMKKHNLSTKEKIELMIEAGHIYVDQPVIRLDASEKLTPYGTQTLRVRKDMADTLKHLGVRVVRREGYDAVIMRDSLANAVGGEDAAKLMLSKAATIEHEPVLLDRLLEAVAALQRR